MALTNGAQLRAARALLQLEKAELAQLAGISPNTLRKMEATNGPFATHKSTVRAVEAALVERGILLFNDSMPGARLDLSKVGVPAA